VPNRYYSSTAGAMTLSAGIAAGDTSITVSTVTGLPTSYPYTLVLDAGSGSEEIVDVTNASGTTLTVARAKDGTSAQSHSSGAVVRHMMSARDLREPQDHMAATQQVHGLAASSAVVGTLDTQTLVNKTLQAATAGTVGAIIKGAASQTADIIQFQSSSGSIAGGVNVSGEGSLYLDTTTRVNASGAAGLFGYVAKYINPASSVVALILKGAASQTGDLQQWQDSTGAVLSKVDSAGNLTVPGVTSAGAVAGATGSFSGAVATGALTVTGGVTASGNVGGATASFTGNETVGGNLTVTGTATAANLSAVPAAKAGKRVFWGTASGTTDASGFLVVTHGAGFTPSVVLAQATMNLGTSFGTISGVDSISSTQFRVRFYNWGSGTGLASTAVSLAFDCKE
jgi:hypothetical protein